MSFQKIFPVAASIAIILLVAILRDRSRAFAAILAAAPINVPLALWVVSSSTDHDPKQMESFTLNLIVSIIPSMIWLVVVFLTIRLGWPLWASIVSGYVVWAGLLGAAFWQGWLHWPSNG